MIFNLSNKYGKENAATEFNRLNEVAATIELKAVKMTRSSAQNRALWLFFQMCSDALNNAGIYHTYTFVDGNVMQIEWTKEMFKQYWWYPIQLAMYETTSTTKLKRNQIDPILNSIFELFGRIGISVTFPNNFDMYLKMFEK
jgi:hypothetical protein